MWFFVTNGGYEFFEKGLELRPPTIESVIAVYIHAINEKMDNDYKQLASSGNYTNEDLDNMKPNYLSWDNERWFTWLEENGVEFLFD